MDENYIRERITQLRIKKGVSEYRMSLDMGHGRSYIQNIVNGRSLPSMKEFLYLCEYLEVTPRDFFDEGVSNPALLQKAVDEMRHFSDQDLLTILSIIERFR